MSGPLMPADHYAMIGRVGKEPRCHVVGWKLRSLLPAIQIPTLDPDPDIPLDLQKAFQAAYEPAFYHRRLRYNEPLVPPLRREDESWAREAIAAMR